LARRRIEGLRAIVTGASSGIGRDLAAGLARQGARVLVTARRGERLDELVAKVEKSGGVAAAWPGDITSAGHRQRLIEEVIGRWGGLDLLVNCAGVGAMGRFDEASPKRLRTVFEVNFFSAAELIRLALPVLRSGQRPMIVNVSSVLGHRAVPLKSEYCASKFALHGFSDALRAELAGDGIDLLLVSPSTTDSEFFDSAVEDKDGRDWKGRRPMATERVAEVAIQAIRLGRNEVILSSGGKLLVWLDRLSPPLVNRLMARFGR
jgi:short-subunit dehydrogenase